MNIPYVLDKIVAVGHSKYIFIEDMMTDRICNLQKKKVENTLLWPKGKCLRNDQRICVYYMLSSTTEVSYCDVIWGNSADKDQTVLS